MCSPVLRAAELLASSDCRSQLVHEFNSSDLFAMKELKYCLRACAPLRGVPHVSNVLMADDFAAVMHSHLMLVEREVPFIMHFNHSMLVQRMDSLKQVFVARLRDLINTILSAYSLRINLLERQSLEIGFHASLSPLDIQTLATDYHRLYLSKKAILAASFVRSAQILTNTIDNANGLAEPIHGNTPKRFNEDTLRVLRDIYLKDMYPGNAVKERLAQITGLTLRQVSTWFMNARSRSKQGLRTFNQLTAKVKMQKFAAEVAADCAKSTFMTDTISLSMKRFKSESMLPQLYILLPEKIDNGVAFNFGMPSPVETEMSFNFCSKQDSTIPTLVTSDIANNKTTTETSLQPFREWINYNHSVEIHAPLQDQFNSDASTEQSDSALPLSENRIQSQPSEGLILASLEATLI